MCSKAVVFNRQYFSNCSLSLSPVFVYSSFFQQVTGTVWAVQAAWAAVAVLAVDRALRETVHTMDPISHLLLSRTPPRWASVSHIQCWAEPEKKKSLEILWFCLHVHWFSLGNWSCEKTVEKYAALINSQDSDPILEQYRDFMVHRGTKGKE